MTNLSLLKPTGHLTLGNNYLGALRPMAAAQDGARCFYGIADLHALTVPHDPVRLRALVTSASTSSSPGTWRCASTGPTARCSPFRRSSRRLPASG